MQVTIAIIIVDSSMMVFSCRTCFGYLYNYAGPGLEAEMHGQSNAFAEHISMILDLKVPIITLLIGNGSCGGAHSDIAEMCKIIEVYIVKELKVY